MSVTTSDWMKGISLSVLATIIGAASKLAIRKSWLMVSDDEYSERGDVIINDDSAGKDELIFEKESNFENASETDSKDNDGGKQEHFYTPLLLRLAGMFGMTFLNPLCAVLAMNYASPSITALFSGLSLVWIVIFSEAFIGEKPTILQIIASTFIVSGELVVGIFGDHTNDEGITLVDLENSYRNPAFLSFFIFIFLWMMLVAYWILYSKSPTLKRFAWGVAGGSVTGIQNFLKDGLTILKVHEGNFFPWYSFVFLALAVSASLGGLLLLTACMNLYSAAYSSAMFVGSYIIVVSIMSATHYDTFQHLEGISSYILYPFGIILLMIGVGILIKETTDNETPNNNSGINNINEGSSLNRRKGMESGEFSYSTVSQESNDSTEEICGEIA